MKKSEFLELIKDVDDDGELFFVSSEYDNDDDLTWDSSTQTEIQEVNNVTKNEAMIVLETKFI